MYNLVSSCIHYFT